MIDIYVQKTLAKAHSDAPITSGSVGLEVQFHFSEEWGGLTKTAIFETDNYKESKQIPESEVITVPDKVLVYYGFQLRVGVYGKSADGSIVTPTVYADCGTIKQGANMSPVETPLTPSQAEHLQAQIDELRERGSGLTVAQVNALDGLFKIAAYTKDASAEYAAFATAFGLTGGDTGGEEEPDEPVDPEVTMSSISATYSGGSVPAGTALNDLTGIVVTAHYSDGSTATVTGYTLSGTIAEGSNTVTVTYQGMTTTITVTGTVVVVYTVTNNLTNVTNSNAQTEVTEGFYSATLTAADGYVINATITMGGVDITADVFTAETGSILITAVTGDIVITATAELATAPVLYQLANTPRTVNADLYEDTGLTFGSETANGYTKAWTMVARVKNVTAGALWSVNSADNFSGQYNKGWFSEANNNVVGIAMHICAAAYTARGTAANLDEICFVITHEAMSVKTVKIHGLSYAAGEVVTSEIVGTYGNFFYSGYAGNMMVGGMSAADFAGTIEEFTIYEGVATEDQIKAYLGVA